MSDEKINKGTEFDKAYDADVEIRSGHEEELQAARDYLNVILKEAEGTYKELEELKAEAKRLKSDVSDRDNVLEQMKAETAERKKKDRAANLWMAFALVELLLIGALIAVLFINSGNGKTADSENIVPTLEAEDNTGHESAGTDVMAEKLTEKHMENLADMIAGETSKEGMLNGNFTMSAERIDGLEYLAFKSSDISVFFKNEYYTDDMSFRKAVIIERGGKRVIYNMSYDIAGLSKLCPALSTVSGKEVIVFTDYESGSRGVPKLVTLVDCESLYEYQALNLKERMKELVKLEFLTEQSGFAEAPILLKLKTSRAEYRYAVSEGDYNEITYNEYELPGLDNNFRISISEDGIRFAAYVMLGDSFYLGELTGSLVLGNDMVVMNEVKYGAFVPANQEDEELKGIILPATEVPEKYITISGMNDERFFIAMSDKIEPCSYSWENLNTDDPNNWIYYDGDGMPASVRGIDVSKYQGDIDWQKVAESGVEFAIIRLGYRGFGEGTLEKDPYYIKNIEGALAAGVKVGVYFFSQAINEQEAVEEADFVLELIKDYEIAYPVVFDTERVKTYDARANSLSRDVRTTMCKVFCDRIREAGYKPMIYANTKYMIMGIDRERLTEYDMWFAYYGSDIRFPYDFQMFQYSESGSIPGISGAVDLNISFVDYAEE